jgi:hypothetical protein
MQNPRNHSAIVVSGTFVAGGYIAAANAALDLIGHGSLSNQVSSYSDPAESIFSSVLIGDSASLTVDSASDGSAGPIAYPA